MSAYVGSSKNLKNLKDDICENQLDDHDRELSSPGSQPVIVTTTVGSRRRIFRDRDRKPVNSFVTRGSFGFDFFQDGPTTRPAVEKNADKTFLFSDRVSLSSGSVGVF